MAGEVGKVGNGNGVTSIVTPDTVDPRKELKKLILERLAGTGYDAAAVDQLVDETYSGLISKMAGKCPTNEMADAIVGIEMLLRILYETNGCDFKSMGLDLIKMRKWITKVIADQDIKPEPGKNVLEQIGIGVKEFRTLVKMGNDPNATVSDEAFRAVFLNNDKKVNPKTAKVPMPEFVRINRDELLVYAASVSQNKIEKRKEILKATKIIVPQSEANKISKAVQQHLLEVIKLNIGKKYLELQKQLGELRAKLGTLDKKKDKDEYEKLVKTIDETEAELKKCDMGQMYAAAQAKLKGLKTQLERLDKNSEEYKKLEKEAKALEAELKTMPLEGEVMATARVLVRSGDIDALLGGRALLQRGFRYLDGFEQSAIVLYLSQSRTAIVSRYENYDANNPPTVKSGDVDKLYFMGWMGTCWGDYGSLRSSLVGKEKDLYKIKLENGYVMIAFTDDVIHRGIYGPGGLGGHNEFGPTLDTKARIKWLQKTAKVEKAVKDAGYEAVPEVNPTGGTPAPDTKK